VFADPAANLALLVEKTAEARAAGATHVIFPEAFLTGYCYTSPAEAFAVAEPLPGPTSARVADLCLRLGVYVAYGTLERADDRLYNAAALVGPEGLVGVYRKTHLPYLGVDKFATHGEGPYRVFDAGGLKVGMLICYDGSFPEAARCLMLEGADAILLPTNWPTGGCGAAEYLTNARAFENAVYFAAVNRIGEERGFRFIGMSRIAGPNGQTLAEAWHDDPAILYADVDPAVARNKHLVRVPGEHEIHRTADRRPDLYGPLTQPTAVGTEYRK
jgi:predicted amidohydrolase